MRPPASPRTTRRRRRPPGPDAAAPGLATDLDVPGYWHGLGLPGLAEIHVHFLPPAVLAKVWGYFYAAKANYGMAWPVHYRTSERDRIDTVRRLGLRAIPSLTYAHRPGMARWLNNWCAEFAARVPDAVHSATFFPETSAATDVRHAMALGARLFKVHVQVGLFSPLDPLLEDAWGVLEDARVPVVAHLGLNEYHAFADLAEAYDGVHLDTTMAATDFTERFAPLPADHPPRLAALRPKVVLGSDFPNIPYA